VSDWQKFFDGYAPKYLEEGFTKNTLAEVDFIIEQFNLPLGSSILDMGCGTGRHSVELAKRGYVVTGVDLSTGMLAEARQAAGAAGVVVEFIQSDATKFTTVKRFDAAICLCEGAFGLVNIGEDGDGHDLSILKNVFAALKPDSPFLLTALSGFRAIRGYTQADVESGRFDPLTLTEFSEMEWDTPDGKQRVTIGERKHLPQELARLCREAGFEVEHIWGGTAGKWGRRKLELDEMEMMLVMRKPNNG
jgi:cyclopropane fatty-acyl-phospholipid synthase-like methyltransferase